MKRMNRMIVVAVGALSLAACGAATEKLTEKAIEAGTGGEVDLDLSGGGGSFSIETEEGKLSVGANGDGTGAYTFESDEGSVSYETTGEIPDDWPDFAYLPDDLKLTGASSQEVGGEFRYSVTGMVERPVAEVTALVREHMGDTSAETVDEIRAILDYEEQGFGISYMIDPVSDEMSVVQVVASQQ